MNIIKVAFCMIFALGYSWYIGAMEETTLSKLEAEPEKEVKKSEKVIHISNQTEGSWIWAFYPFIASTPRYRFRAYRRKEISPGEDFEGISIDYTTQGYIITPQGLYTVSLLKPAEDFLFEEVFKGYMKSPKQENQLHLLILKQPLRETEEIKENIVSLLPLSGDRPVIIILNPDESLTVTEGASTSKVEE